MCGQSDNEGYYMVRILSSSGERYFQHEKIRRPCNVLFILKILLKFPHKTQLFLFIFETAKLVTYRKMSLIAISSHVKDKNSIFTARSEDMIFY